MKSELLHHDILSREYRQYLNKLSNYCNHKTKDNLSRGISYTLTNKYEYLSIIFKSDVISLL